MINDRFERLLKECKNELNSLGIRYYNVEHMEVNTRAKTRWGQCRKNNRTGVFTINLSDELLKTSNKDIKDTIIHELLHTVEGCLNHGSMWKYYASKVNDKYGYNVSRTTSYADKGMTRVIKTTKEHKYNVICMDCGKTYNYERKCKVIDNIHMYNCPVCKKGKFEVKTNF